jgi:hypothetical protein
LTVISTAVSADQDRLGRFVVGNRASSGRLSRAELARRVEATLLELAAEFGGLSSLTASEKLLLRKAAELTVYSPPRNPVDRVRCVNATIRAVNLIRKARGAKRWLRLPARP